MSLDKKRASEILDAFKSLKIAVVGDVMLDHYLFGNVERISPEAPVPVVEVLSEEYRLGGAANVASNLSHLGVNTYLCGVVGDDNANIIMSKKLKELNIENLNIISDKPTTQKTRIIASHQQLIRIDWEDKSPFLDFKQILDKLPKDIDGIIVSDYAKGLITKDLVEALTKTYSFVAADPKPSHKQFYHNVTLLTPNEKEARTMLNEEDIVTLGKSLKTELNLTYLAITLGPKGVAFFEDDAIHTYSAKAKEVYDVTGAGDTFIAVLTASLLAGAKTNEACEIANTAAGIVVSKIGAASTTKEEILENL
jgi:ADP-heptose synthase, bifunctional sugar kinase/adenylyltransferase